MSRDILLNLIDPDPEQPRKHFDQTALDELAQSMEANGLAVPILVRPVGERFMLVHGERRYRAAKQLEWETIPAEVRELSEEEARWLSLVENVQRADLSPIEEARVFQAHLATGMTQEGLAKRIGKTRTYITTKLRFLRLDEDIQAALAAGLISEGHAKQLLRVDISPLQYVLCCAILRDGLSVHQLHEVIDIALASPPHILIILTMYGEEENQTIVDLVNSFSWKLDKLIEYFTLTGENVKRLYSDRRQKSLIGFYLDRWGLDEETAADCLAFLEYLTLEHITDRMHCQATISFRW